MIHCPGPACVTSLCRHCADIKKRGCLSGQPLFANNNSLLFFHRVINILRDIEILHVLDVELGNAVRQHGHTEGACRADLRGARGLGVLGPELVDPRSQMLFKEHPRAARAAAEARAVVAAHFDEIHARN